MRLWALLFLASAERIYDFLDVKVHPFPTSCNGTQALQGNYTVEVAAAIPTSCRLQGRGATVLLKAPLTFSGDVIMEGDIAWIGEEPFSQACVAARSLQIGGGSSKDRISFQDCHNRKSFGGALLVENNLAVLPHAALSVQQCSSFKGGGGAYVSGTVMQEGHVEMSGCHSEGGGGGLQATIGLVQGPQGVMSFSQCQAQDSGGGLLVEGDLQLQGKLRVEDCASEAQGGGVTVHGTLLQLAGTIGFQNCTAAVAGGGLHVSAWNQTKGFASFRLCQAGAGGAVFSSGDVHLAGTNQFNVSKASNEVSKRRTRGSGGGMSIRKGNLVQHGGSMSFFRCEAESGYGGGLSLDSGFLHQMSEAVMVFVRCKAHSGGSWRVGGEVQLQGSMSCSNSEADYGGCGTLGSGITVVGGELFFTGCMARTEAGGLMVAKTFVQEAGTVSFNTCRSQHTGAGCLQVGALKQSNGSLRLAGCTSQTGSGGIVSKGPVDLAGSNVFSDCSTKSSGAGLSIKVGNLVQHGGSTRFERCNAEGDGGGVYLDRGSLHQKDGVMDFLKCSANGRGGSLRVKGDLIVRGNLSCSGSHARVDGGGAIVGGKLKQLGGHLVFKKCTANRGEGGGGALVKFVVQEGGTMSFRGCEANGKGASCLRTRSLTQLNGSMQFTGCKGGDSGAVLSKGPVELAGSNLFSHSSNEKHGGGCLLIKEGNLTQHRGVTEFDRCKAGKGGGGLLLEKGSLHQKAEGTMVFSNCEARALRGAAPAAVAASSGGGLRANGALYLHGHLSFKGCKATVFGGGAQVTLLRQLGGTLVVEGCTAGSGGGMHVKRAFAQDAGKVSFRNCTGRREGGCLYTRNFNQSGGSSEFMHCRGKDNGGAIYSWRDVHLGGSTFLANSSVETEDAHGGCLLVAKGNLTQSGDTKFSGCAAYRGHGGGLGLLNGSLILAAGTMDFDSCTASWNGGGAFVPEHVEVISGKLTFLRCRSKGWEGGGGLYVSEGDLLQHGGATHFQDCKAASGGGGGVHIQQGALQLLAGRMSFERCAADGAQGGGGLLLTQGDFRQAAGSALFSYCAARAGYGGGLNLIAGSLHQSSNDGSLNFYNCEARAGGGVAVKRNGTLLGVSTFNSCVARSRSAERGGGGVFLDKGYLHLHGSLHMTDCSTMSNGGGVLVKRGGIIAIGNVSVTNSSARRSGGGIYLAGKMEQLGAGVIEFRHCAAYSAHGGGMWAGGLSSHSEILFDSCTAGNVDGNGGGLAIEGAVEQTGTMSFLKCSTGGKGGGFYVNSTRPGMLQHISFDQCSTVGVAHSLFSTGPLNISDLKLLCNDANDVCVDVHSELSMVGVRMKSNGSVSIRASALDSGRISCTDTKACQLLTPKASRSIAGLVCPLGTGVNDTDGEKSCETCSDNYTQVQLSTTAPCNVCPIENEFCYARNFKMKPGHMVKDTNVSFTYYCPNPAACPGGNSSNFTSMCAKGYTGKSCARCSQDEGFAISDSSVLLCTQCAAQRWKQYAQWGYMLLKRVVPFGLSAASVLKGDAEVKPSGVLINQLMSFATVAGMLLTVMAQTAAMEQIKGNAGVAFDAVFGVLGGVADMASGQATFEDSSGGMSSICLLWYIGFSGMLWQVHLLHSLVPALLVAGLMAFLPHEKRRVAIVVGLNCFWPEVFSFFGKHLYCYQYAPQLIKRDAFECPFMPDPTGRLVLRVLAVLMILAVAGIWVRLSLPSKGSQESPGSLPLHVLFLTKPYRPGVALWESERLFRKTLLTMAVSALPITSSPALQLACIGSIVTVSLILYIALLPYKALRWNLTECALLLTAVLMTVLVFGLTAYDSYWGRDIALEYGMIMAAVALAGSFCLVMMYLIYRELMQEWYKQKHPVEAEGHPVEAEGPRGETNDSLLWLKFI